MQGGNMLVVQVNICVKDNFIDQFITATRENVEKSLKEKGIARFDFLQNIENPSKFLLTEAYRNDNAPAFHKETAHYQKWKSTVECMMVEPRNSVKYNNILPEDNEF